jgi:outer membrane protein
MSTSRLSRVARFCFLPACGALVIFVSLFSAQSNAMGGEKSIVLTLEKSIALALEHNRDLAIADQDRSKADAQITEARSGALPQLNFSGQYGRNIQKPVLFLPPGTPFNESGSPMKFEIGSDNLYNFGLQLYQPIYSRKVGTALEIAEIYHDYSEKSFESTMRDVVLSVKKAFYGVLLAQRLVEVNKEGLEVVRANFENVKSLYNHGAAAEFDLLRAEVQLANTEPALIQAENNLELGKNALKNLLAIDLKQEIVVQGEFTFDDVPPELLQQANREALARNPAVQQLSLQESILEKNIQIESANHYPTLGLVGTYQWQTQDNTFRFSRYNWAQTFTLGLQVSYSLFDGFRTSARTEQARVDKQRIQYARLKAEEGLKIQILQAEMRMTEAKKRIAAQEKSIGQAEKALKIAQTRYKSGVGTHLELLDTQVAMTRTQTTYAQAIYDYLIARAEWERAVGLPEKF